MYIYRYSIQYHYLSQNTPGACSYERKQPRKRLVEKDVNQNGRPWPPAFDRIKSFDHHDLTAKLVALLFGCSRSPDVDEIKIFDKDDQAAKHCFFILMFCGLVMFIKNFDLINIRRL